MGVGARGRLGPLLSSLTPTFPLFLQVERLKALKMYEEREARRKEDQKNGAKVRTLLTFPWWRHLPLTFPWCGYTSPFALTFHGLPSPSLR